MTDNNFFDWCDPLHGTKCGVGNLGTKVGAEPKAL